MKKGSKTFVYGKDLALEDSLKNMKRALNKYDVCVVEKKTLHPVSGVYSVHLIHAKFSFIYSNGKGNSLKSALVSAYGEFIERWFFNQFLNDCFIDLPDCPYIYYPFEKWGKVKGFSLKKYLPPNLFKFYSQDINFSSKLLVDVNATKKKGEICLLPFVRYSDNKQIYFPNSLVNMLYVTNGMAVGNSKYEAYVQALCEIIERSVKFTVLKDNISLPIIPESYLRKKNSNSLKTIIALKRHGFEIFIKDASLGGKFPVVNVTLVDLKTGGCFASFGAHPSFEVALERTVTELLQGRTVNDFTDLQKPVTNSSDISSRFNLESHFINSEGYLSYDFFKSSRELFNVQWDFIGSTEKEYEYLIQLIEKEGFQIYSQFFKRENINFVRILIPGMSEVYPVDDLYWCNYFQFSCFFRKQIMDLSSLNKKDLNSLLNEFSKCNIEDELKIKDLIGMHFSNKSIWSTLLTGELKIFILLFVKDRSNLLELLNWSLVVEDIPLERRKLYECLKVMLELDVESDVNDYQTILITVFSKKIFSLACHLLQGNVKFKDLFTFKGALQGVREHKRLMREYKKRFKLVDEINENSAI